MRRSLMRIRGSVISRCANGIGCWPNTTPFTCASCRQLPRAYSAGSSDNFCGGACGGGAGGAGLHDNAARCDFGAHANLDIAEDRRACTDLCAFAYLWVAVFGGEGAAAQRDAVPEQ